MKKKQTLTLMELARIGAETHPDYSLLEDNVLSMDERAMNIDYEYELVFKEDKSGTIFIANVTFDYMIEGECWNDYLANDCNDYGEDEIEIFEAHQILVEKYVRK